MPHTKGLGLRVMHPAWLELVGVQPNSIGMATAGSLLVWQRPIHPLPTAPPPTVQQVLVCLAAQFMRPHALKTRTCQLSYIEMLHRQ